MNKKIYQILSTNPPNQIIVNDLFMGSVGVISTFYYKSTSNQDDLTSQIQLAISTTSIKSDIGNILPDSVTVMLLTGLKINFKIFINKFINQKKFLKRK